MKALLNWTGRYVNQRDVAVGSRASCLH